MNNFINLYTLSSDPSLNTGHKSGASLSNLITGQLAPGLGDGGVQGVNVVVMMNTDPWLKFSPH